jgi:hypothetical protein
MPINFINQLQRALVGGEQHLLEQIPVTLGLVIKQNLWRGCLDKKGQPFPTFEAFANYKLWWGLESSIDDLLAFCRKAPDVQALIRAEVGAVAAHGANQHTQVGGDIIPSSSQRGTSATHTLRRLKRDAPELAAKVVAGKLTANAAAIEAGFRLRTISVPLDPVRAAVALKRHFTPAKLRALATELHRGTS